MRCSRCVLLPLFLLLAVAWRCSGDDEDDYKEIFEDVDVDSILDNDRILDSYVKCILGNSPCSERPQKVKDRIPETFETVCGKCSDKQKATFKHVLKVFIPKRPDDWKRMLEIYDPEGKFWPGIKAFLES